MTDEPARREKTGDLDADGIGRQATLRSSEIRRPDGAALVQASPDGSPGTLEIGTKLEGVYEVKRLLGRGAMGAVYLVAHIGLGKEFAAKVVGGSRALDAAAVARLRNEARIASSIEHENIVNVTHLGQTGDGTVFIVMEFLRGEDLRQRLERQLAAHESDGTPAWLPDAEVRDIVGPVLAGLAAAHGAGVVHRDLKPDNIFLAQIRGKMKPKLVDFGIGKLRAAENDLRLTETGQIIGTPLYMAPEQTRSTSQIDHRADLYSLAVMIFEMVCGRPPFEAAHLFEIVVKHATEAPPDPRTFRPDLPAPVAELILRALRKEPSERFTGADEMLALWTAAWEEAGHPPAPPRPSVVSGAPEQPRRDAGTTGPMPVAGEVTDHGVRLPAAAPAAPAAPAATGTGRLIAVGAGALVLGALAFFALGGAGGEPAAVAPAPPVVEAPPPPPPPVAEVVPEVVPPPALEPLPVGIDVPAGHHHTVTSVPPGAEVVRDGVVLGTTPYELDVPAGETVEVELRLDGYRTLRRTIAPDAPAPIEGRLVRRERSGGSSGAEAFPGLAPR